MTKDLKDLQLSDFKQYVGTEFHIHFQDEGQNTYTYSVTLQEAVAIGVKDRDITAHGRESFSLIFSHDDPSKHLMQQVYQLHHDELGNLDLFVVPIGIVDDKINYEVIIT